jgi:hypothetical protein
MRKLMESRKLAQLAAAAVAAAASNAAIAASRREEHVALFDSAEALILCLEALKEYERARLDRRRDNDTSLGPLLSIGVTKEVISGLDELKGEEAAARECSRFLERYVDAEKGGGVGSRGSTKNERRRIKNARIQVGFVSDIQSVLDSNKTGSNIKNNVEGVPRVRVIRSKADLHALLKGEKGKGKNKGKNKGKSKIKAR